MGNDYKLTKEERETVIRASAADSDWDVCTADPRIARYLMKQGYAPDPDHQFSDPYMAFRMPFGRLRFLKREKRKPSGRPFKSHRHAQEPVCGT